MAYPVLGELGGGALDPACGLECGERFREVFLKKLTVALNLSERHGQDEDL